MSSVRSRLLIAAALAALPTIAAAQDAGRPDRGGRPERSYNGGGGRDRGQVRSQVDRPAAPPAAVRPQQAPQDRARAGNFAHGYAGQAEDFRRRGLTNQANRPAIAQNDRRNDDRRDWNGRDDRRNWRPDVRGDDRRFDNRSAWNGNRGNFRRDWRNDRRYDWRSYRNVNRSLFRSRYIAPRGYSFGYRPFSIGYRIDPFFYAQNYWIADPYQYRLPPAYGPYRWVRYYDDVLLVDIDTGEVVDVINGFFW